MKRGLVHSSSDKLRTLGSCRPTQNAMRGTTAERAVANHTLERLSQTQRRFATPHDDQWSTVEAGRKSGPTAPLVCSRTNGLPWFQAKTGSHTSASAHRDLAHRKNPSGLSRVAGGFRLSFEVSQEPFNFRS